MLFYWNYYSLCGLVGGPEKNPSSLEQRDLSDYSAVLKDKAQLLSLGETTLNSCDFIAKTPYRISPGRGRNTAGFAGRAFPLPQAPRSVQADSTGRWHMLTITLVGACDQDEAVVEHETQLICSPNVCHFSHHLVTCQSHCS